MRDKSVCKTRQAHAFKHPPPPSRSHGPISCSPLIVHHTPNPAPLLLPSSLSSPHAHATRSQRCPLLLFLLLRRILSYLPCNCSCVHSSSILLLPQATSAKPPQHQHPRSDHFRLHKTNQPKQTMSRHMSKADEATSWRRTTALPAETGSGGGGSGGGGGGKGGGYHQHPQHHQHLQHQRPATADPSLIHHQGARPAGLESKPPLPKDFSAVEASALLERRWVEVQQQQGLQPTCQCSSSSGGNTGASNNDANNNNNNNNKANNSKNSKNKKSDVSGSSSSKSSSSSSVAAAAGAAPDGDGGGFLAALENAVKAHSADAAWDD